MQAFGQSTTTRLGTFDASGVTEYSQYLYVGPGAHITIPAGQTWVIASQYIFIDPTAIIDGGGQIILDDPGNFGPLSESVAWAGQPTTIDGGNSKILANVVNRNPNNIVLGAVAVTADAGFDGIVANTDHTLYIGNSFTWAPTHGDGTALAYNDVVLGNNDFKFSSTATEAGFTQNAYAVTNGTGHVVKENYTGNWVYPVGISESSASGSDYTPASINNATPSDMHVLVQNYATSASVEAGSNGIDRTWNIYSSSATASATVDLQHNRSTSQAAFGTATTDNPHFVTRYSGLNPNHTGDGSITSLGPWQSNTLGAAEASPGTLTTGSMIANASERSKAYTNFATSASDPIAYYSKSSNATTPLPVKLLDFTGVAQACMASLSWTTADEQGFDHFEVQQSTDGHTFKTIDKISSHKIPTGSSYGGLYEQPAKVAYYRLSMADNNGDYRLSNTISVRTNCDPEVASGTAFHIYPNPSTSGGQLFLDYAAVDAATASILCHNQLGQLIFKQPVELKKGSNKVALAPYQLASGIYLFQLRSESGLLGTPQRIEIR